MLYWKNSIITSVILQKQEWYKRHQELTLFIFPFYITYGESEDLLLLQLFS